MPRTQYSYVERQHAESGQNGTATYDLPERDYLEGLIVTAYSTPTATTNPALPLSDAITKIEVIDGGMVLKSLTANQVKALEMIHNSPQASGPEWNKTGVEHWDTFAIDLGKLIDGTMYAPDMSRLSNPQIQITWDYSITTTQFGMTCDADTTPSMKFSVIAKMLRDGPNVTHGYLRSQKIYEFTQATSTTTVTEIPRKYPIVGIGVEAGYDTKNWCDDVEEVKLDFDNGSWIPFHLYEAEIPFMQQFWFNTDWMYSWSAMMESSDELDTHMGLLTDLCVRPTSGAGRAAEYEWASQGVDTFWLWDLATPTETDEYQMVYMTSHGFMPFHMWYCPFSALTGNTSDIIDSTRFGRIELETTSSASASTSSTPAIILEELVT